MPGPTHRASTVIKREGKEDYWLNLGVCFAHEDGEGSNAARRQTGPPHLQGEKQEKVIKGKFKQ